MKRTSSISSYLVRARRSPSPQPSPRGEGAHFARAGGVTEPRNIRAVGNGSPSPWGEGWGEGDSDVRPPGALHGNEGDSRPVEVYGEGRRRVGLILATTVAAMLLLAGAQTSVAADAPKPLDVKATRPTRGEII